MSQRYLMFKLDRNTMCSFDFKFLSREQIPIKFDLNLIDTLGSTVFDQDHIRWWIWSEDVFKKQIVSATTYTSHSWNPAIHFVLCEPTHLGKLLPK